MLWEGICGRIVDSKMDLTPEQEAQLDVLMEKTPEQRLRARYTVLENGCWEWTGGKFSNGYGQFGPLGSAKNQLAHRVSWTLRHGPIPDDLVIDHLCRNVSCVNPDHMEVVTQKINSRRGRGAKTECIHGHPYDEENTGWKHDKKRGWRRYCRACARETRRAKAKDKTFLRSDGGEERDPALYESRRKDRSHLTREWPTTF